VERRLKLLKVSARGIDPPILSASFAFLQSSVDSATQVKGAGFTLLNKVVIYSLNASIFILDAIVMHCAQRFQTQNTSKLVFVCLLQALLQCLILKSR